MVEQNKVRHMGKQMLECTKILAHLLKNFFFVTDQLTK